MVRYLKFILYIWQANREIMASTKSPEHRIRVKIGLIFLVVILYFLGLIAYSSSLKTKIDAQKESIDNSYRVLSYSDQLIHSVQQAQEVLNLYLVNPRRAYRNQYDSISEDINRQILNIQNTPTGKEQALLLEDIDSLLQEKNRIITRLLNQFRSENPLLELDKRIETYDDIIQDSLVITTNQDTTVVQAQRRNFWGRLRQLIDPENQPDTMVTITRTEQEARASSRVDTVRYADLKNITREASESYATQIARIEWQVRELLLAEQHISLHISQLISRFYTEAIETTRLGTDNSELLTRGIIGFAITVGMLSVLLILVIIFFITDDLNKGQRARSDLAREKQLTEELIESRHRLLLSVSHDIKTPLSSMMGYMEIWDADEEQAQKKRQLRSARNSGKHILSMLNNLLEFSRLEQNSGKLQTSRFNLIELMEDIVSMFQPFTEEKGLALQFRNHLSSPYIIESDYTVLKQILVNVISNAVKYTLDGSVDIELSHDKQPVFTITDTGVGIEEKDIPKIFKPFSRVSNPLKTEGSGFGLYVTKGLVNTLGGDIQLQSEKGEGTAVTIRLPLMQVTEEVPAEGNEHPAESKPAYSKVLLFEDDASLGNMLKEFLVHRGYKVKLCSNPRDVKGFLRVISSFDIVFTDMQMTGISGKDILRDIRAAGSDIPVWLMTAYGDYTTEKAIAEGFTGFITKPVSMRRLIATLSGTDGTDAGGPEPATSAQHPLSVRFPQLSSMFDHDTEAIKDILEGFIKSSRQDTLDLREMIRGGEFARAQQLCHRMHPFFVQLDAEHLCGTLRKMDMLRGEEESAYPGWKEELTAAVENIELFRENIREEYL